MRLAVWFVSLLTVPIVRWLYAVREPRQVTRPKVREGEKTAAQMVKELK